VRRSGRRILLVLLAAGALGWLDPSATPREAARLYAAGKYDDAAAKYNQALVDEPDSALLHFNLGDAEYRRNQYDAALRAFASLPDDAAAQYNQGNALYQMGLAAEQAKPQEALQKWAEALVAYRRAIASDPADEDAKFNYEWVTRKIEELQKKLQEQQQNQDQQQNQQNDQQDQQDQDQQAGQQQDDARQPQDHEQEEQRQAGEQPEQNEEQQAEQPDRQQAGEQQPPEGEQRQAQGGEGRPAEGELSPEEATALLDGERSEELRPDEVIRRQLGAGEGPVQDW